AVLARAWSVVRMVCLRSGPVEPLMRAIETLDLTVTRERPWMLRLVDAPAAIAARGYADDVRVEVPLEITDAACPWNVGRHTLVVERGAGRLERGGSGAVRLGIRALASLYSGRGATPPPAPTRLRGPGGAAQP